MRRRHSQLFVITALVGLVCLPIPALADSEERTGAWLGVMMGDPSRIETDAGGEAPASGVPIRLVVEGSPAAEAGLRARDRILGVNGHAVTSAAELLEQLRREAPGNWVPLSIARGDDDDMDVRVQLGSRPESPKRLKLRRGTAGVEAIDLPPALRVHFGATSETGVMISKIFEGSPGEAAGFELGDVVFEIDGEDVRSARDLFRLVSEGGVGNQIEFKAMRNGSEVVLEAILEVESSLKKKSPDR